METNKFDIIIENNDVFSSYYDENNEQIIRLKNASNINIFIGANNSGKSRFIRNLLNYKTFKILNHELLIKELKSFNEYIESLNFKIKNHSSHVDFINLKSTFIEFLKFDLPNDLFNEIENIKKIISHNFKILNLFEKETTKIYLPANILSIENRKIIKNKISEIENLLHSSIGKLMKNIFIPTLRTAHSIFYKKQNSETYTKIADDIFKETIIKNYKIDEEKTEIFTGLTLYNEIVNARNNTEDVRSRFESFEKFISNNFFQGKRIDIVAKLDIYKKNKQNDETELINIYIDGESKDLYELGDGIQALIILLYKIFMCEENSLIFIDEPEINLHPGMQRLFLEQITNNEVLKKKNLTYFISTHSNHFLDLTIEKDNISVFLFNKLLEEDKPKFIVKNVNNGDNSPLQYLGISNSSVFLANCSIWVEGISDRNYLKAFLKAYCKHLKVNFPKEDIDFTFIEYAGSNIDHYNFNKDELKEKINAFALNNKIFLVSDYDGEYKNQKHNFYNSYKHENFTYKTTKPYKEVENLLSLKVWNKILIHFCNKRKIETEENYNNVKSKIQITLAKFVGKKYEDVYIGKLLSEVRKFVPELNKIWHDSEGTIINKAELSKKVLELTENGELSWDDFKQNSKVNNITSEIYNFINKNKFN